MALVDNITSMTELSPAAQAVITAILEISPAPADEIAAAALRAAADQVVPLYACSLSSTRGTTRLGVRQKFLAIAAELEGAND